VLACAIALQASLGILTLLEQAPLALALMHQGMAMIVLTIATLHAQAMSAPEASRSAGLAPMRATAWRPWREAESSRPIRRRVRELVLRRRERLLEVGDDVVLSSSRSKAAPHRGPAPAAPSAHR